ncbi:MULTISPECIES: hypothetical protein [Methylobacterium]|uniref:PepSY domain-containing protein n=2 Tax=Methylobacterium TaxID=407 RepID=A0ABQ4SSV9_9HYPH|nr:MULTISPECIES: hypothetical protein [Methylobacterium]PIU05134.1 MAG: hypothetical protein COT56_16860 [Methylobacterium sp. CG09_land_8_20_14_0_10_71_15]PIU12848.1 MAG: hypothetical protein COT28_13520 [Methylobacterium sp. CG08_land_8_20_14_0_20_71_15]GBU17563.1 hypothetical protein AwMethylo_17780 [Methylobacterium sp.]GJE06192.1 hypothetical protein AOPFMNJM_1506 [Methylobacterium jeotgali]
MDSSNRMTGRTARALLAGLVLSAAGAATVPAQAQYVYDDVLLPPRAVAWRLGERGYSGLSRPRFDGRAYVVEAFAPDGGRVRLFVDARDGIILGRQRLGEPVYAPPPVRVARPAAPGYGWTEDDMAQGRLVPPANIPYPGVQAEPRRPVIRSETPVRRAELPARPDAVDPNTLGLNPDAQRRPEPARKAKAVAPATAAKPRIAPEPPVAKAPEPSAAETKPAPVEAKPAADEPAKVAARPEPSAAPAPAAPTPASVQPPPQEKAADSSWKEPPTEKRNVRVIGGATMVPGDAKSDAQMPRAE